MKSSNMKIGVRLVSAFAAIVFLMMIVGGIAISKMGQLDSQIGSLVEDKWPKALYLSDIGSKVNDILINVNYYSRSTTTIIPVLLPHVKSYYQDFSEAAETEGARRATGVFAASKPFMCTIS